jgi:hypothetical protein
MIPRSLVLGVLALSHVQAPPPPTRAPIGGLGSEPCLASAGYSWCAATRSCMQQWVTPCPDNFQDCKSCLASQRNGVNIACPSRCDAMVDVSTVIDTDPCTCPPEPPCPLVVSSVHGCTVQPAPTDDCGCTIGCPSVHCTAGQPCGGFTAYTSPECTAPYECVQTMGPLVADAPGQCREPCAMWRDFYGNCIEPGCTVWYDGCNTCHIDIAQGLQGCTRMFCDAPGPAGCHDQNSDRAREREVCHRFCEDGREDPVHAACDDGLTCVAPGGVGFDSCGALASRCVRIPGDPVAGH